MEPPRYCPFCKRAAPDLPGIDSCPECGEPLEKQGFCPVCDNLLLLPPGKMCPKHDVKLEDPSLADEADENQDASSWVTLETYADDTTARACRLRLESEGIPTRLENERMGSRSMYAVATGGVGLRVPEEHVADARVILDQDWSIPPAEDEIDGAEEDEESDLAGEDRAERRRRSMKAVVWLLLAPTVIGGVLLIVVVLGLVYRGLASLFGW
jgi:hypothetical protein